MPPKKKELPPKQLTLRIPEDLHRSLKVKSASEGKSMGSVVEHLIREYVATNKKGA